MPICTFFADVSYEVLRTHAHPSDELCSNQLYFDRVHDFAPILHQQRYFSWARQSTKIKARTCLQHAMWMLAASLSAQYQHIRDPLYRSTRELLEGLDLTDDKMESVEIEQAQAWVLLAIYEFMRTSYRRAWMSAGRAFRLVQLMRLYELDAPNTVDRRPSITSLRDEEAWTATEEKRRTFWMAYCLDRFISIRNVWPLTLNEQVVSLFSENLARLLIH